MDNQKEFKKDIFYKILSLKPFLPFRSFYVKNRKVLLYIFFGGLTTFVSLFTFWLFSDFFRLHELIANPISWVFAVLFAYLTNRTWVFSSKAKKPKDVIFEASRFFGGRVFSLLVEQLIIFIFITKLGFQKMLIKLLAGFVVLILNYIISKVIVFREK